MMLCSETVLKKYRKQVEQYLRRNLENVRKSNGNKRKSHRKIIWKG